jgi:hypothetical protein
MGSFKNLSDPHYWEKVVPKVQQGYIPFKHTIEYLAGLVKDKQLLQDEIKKKSGITNKKEFDQLFSTFDKLPGTIPITFLEALDYQERDLKEAYYQDLDEWKKEVSSITKFPDEYLFTTHIFYLIHRKYSEDLKTIDEKLEYLIQKAKEESGGGIYHCCIDLYPLLQIYFRPGGECIVTGRKPIFDIQGDELKFTEGSDEIALPEFLKESKIISESKMQEYHVSFSLTMKGREVPMFHVSGNNVRKL